MTNQTDQADQADLAPLTPSETADAALQLEKDYEAGAKQHNCSSFYNELRDLGSLPDEEKSNLLVQMVGDNAARRKNDPSVPEAIFSDQGNNRGSITFVGCLTK